jgi:hypothetical protein
MPMFHVEHMKTRYFFIILPIFALISCTKADPEAYRRDPILQDYQSQLGVLNGELEAVKKQVEGTQKDIQTSVPQSGQRAIYQKKMNDLNRKVNQLTQQIQFWKIRIESRAKEAQLEYLGAFKSKKEWPDPGKVESYFAEKRLRIAKMTWSQKDRIQEYKKNNQKGSAAGSGGEAGDQKGGH